jgi:prepilin-type N-terminal cleavage/methylation domain-containing protein
MKTKFSKMTSNPRQENKMKTKIRSVRRGFTLIELFITMAVGVVVILGLGVVMSDSQKGWNSMYERVYADATSDGYVAKIKFDKLVRKSSRNKFLIDPTGDWVEVYYYSDPAVTVPDRYARVYVSGGDLNAEHGKVDPRETLNTEVLCSSVKNCQFLASDGSVQMKLDLDDGDHEVTVLSSAIMHNE